MNTHRGHCRCGAVVALVQGEPDHSVFCHCDDCRRSAGAPLIAAIGVKREHIRWEADEAVSRYINRTCTRSFCSICGSSVAQEHDSAPDYVFFNTAFMDEPELFPPTYHSFAGQQFNWMQLSDDLPRYEKTKFINTD